MFPSGPAPAAFVQQPPTSPSHLSNTCLASFSLVHLVCISPLFIPSPYVPSFPIARPLFFSLRLSRTCLYHHNLHTPSHLISLPKQTSPSLRLQSQSTHPPPPHHQTHSCTTLVQTRPASGVTQTKQRSVSQSSPGRCKRKRGRPNSRYIPSPTPSP